MGAQVDVVELVLDALLSALGIIIVAQYTWAGRGHFSSEKMPRGAMLISVVVLITTFLFLYLTWTEVQPLPARLVGLALQVFSWWLFWQAIGASRSARLRLAFDEAGPRGLVTGGPYNYVRHPFYTSYVIFWIGWTVALWAPVALLPCAILIAIYVTAGLMEERKFESSPMADEYRAYRQRAGFFWPRLRGSSLPLIAQK